MKKLISLILVVLLLCAALPALAAEDVTGKWYLTAIRMNDGETEFEVTDGMTAMTMKLNADGSAVVDWGSGDTTPATWVLNGDKITVYLNGESPASGVVSNGRMTLTDEDGYTMFFARSNTSPASYTVTLNANGGTCFN